MIIPVIFSLDPTNSNMSHLWSFYKGISFSKRYGWPVIAQERYFRSFQQQKNEFPYFFQEAVCDKFDYDCPEENDLLKITKVILPEEIEERYIRKYPSQTDAFLASLVNGWEEMEEFLEAAIKHLEAVYKEKTEAILILQGCKFVDNVAERLAIPVIHYEWGPMRYDVYRNTTYLDWAGIAGDTCFPERFRVFKEHKYEQEVPVFSRRELLALFLNPSYLHYATDEYSKPVYKMGLALGYTNAGLVTARTAISPLELYTKVRKFFKEEEIAIRYHPGDPLHSCMRKPNEDTGTLIDFILKCERITCVSSNVAFEAMLFGRHVYEEHWSQYALICDHLDEGITDTVPDNVVLSFIMFCVLVPYELLKVPEYLRFRLREKDEKKIYLYHLNYYLSVLGIDSSVLKLPEEQRLEAILAARRKYMDEKTELLMENYIECADECNFEKEVVQAMQIERKRMQIEQKNAQIQEMSAYIEKILKESKEQYEELVKTNELLKQEQEYSKSLLEGIAFRDGEITFRDGELEKERNYSKSLMDGILYRDSKIEELEKNVVFCRK